MRARKQAGGAADGGGPTAPADGQCPWSRAPRPRHRHAFLLCDALPARRCSRAGRREAYGGASPQARRRSGRADARLDARAHPRARSAQGLGLRCARDYPSSFARRGRDATRCDAAASSSPIAATSGAPRPSGTCTRATTCYPCSTTATTCSPCSTTATTFSERAAAIRACRSYPCSCSCSCSCIPRVVVVQLSPPYFHAPHGRDLKMRTMRK